MRQNAAHLKKMLVYKNVIMPLGILSFCLEYDQNSQPAGGSLLISVNTLENLGLQNYWK